MTRQVRMVVAMLVTGTFCGCAGSDPAGPSAVSPAAVDGNGTVHGMPRRSMGQTFLAPACQPLPRTIDAEGLTADFSVCGSSTAGLFVSNSGPHVVYVRAGNTVTTADAAVPAGTGILSPGLAVSLVTATGGSATVTLTPVE